MMVYRKHFILRSALDESRYVHSNFRQKWFYVGTYTLDYAIVGPVSNFCVQELDNKPLLTFC